jgi:hypothetical protein
MFGLILLFSILLPNTFPTMLNLRSILSRQGDHCASVPRGDDPDGGGSDRPDRGLRHRAVAHPGDQPANDVGPALARGRGDRADPWHDHRGAERPAGRSGADRQLHRHARHGHGPLRAGAVAHRRAADGGHVARCLLCHQRHLRLWPADHRLSTCWPSPDPLDRARIHAARAATSMPSAPTSARPS